MKNSTKNKIVASVYIISNNLIRLERRSKNENHKRIIADIRTDIENAYNDFFDDTEDCVAVNALASNIMWLVAVTNRILPHIFGLRRTNILRACNNAYSLLTGTKDLYTKNIFFRKIYI